MAQKARKIRVGLFVLTGMILVTLAVIILFAGRYFSDTRRYATYFAESVQGLDRNAPVKYNGVRVGRVVNINIARNEAYVQVLMDIAKEHDFNATTHVARLQNVNISGMRYIELERRGERPRLAPKLRYKPKYPVIPSYPSPKMFDVLETINAKLDSIDAKRISDGMVQMLDQMNILFDTNKWQPIVAKMSDTLAVVNRFSRDLDVYADSSALSNMVHDARQAMSRLNEIAAVVQTQRVEQLLQELTQLSALLNSSLGTIDANLQPLLQSLQQSVDNLRSFSEALKTRPSQTMFGTPVDKEPR